MDWLEIMFVYFRIVELSIIFFLRIFMRYVFIFFVIIEKRILELLRYYKFVC